MNQPVPGPIFDVHAILQGGVDLRSYPRRTLVLSSQTRVPYVLAKAGHTAAIYEPVLHLLNAVELLETQGWELVSVVERSVDVYSSTMAFMRRG